MNNKRRCEDCEIDINRASYSRHLKSEKHIINEERNLSKRIRTFMTNSDFDVYKISADGVKFEKFEILDKSIQVILTK